MFFSCRAGNGQTIDTSRLPQSLISQTSQISCKGIPGAPIRDVLHNEQKPPLLCLCCWGGNDSQRAWCSLKGIVQSEEIMHAHMKYYNRSTGRTPTAQFRHSSPHCNSRQFPIHANTEALNHLLFINNQILDEDWECNQKNASVEDDWNSSF